MASIFTHIINGDLPGNFVWKDDVAVAFMTIQPVLEGHLLVVPRAEVDHWDDLAPEVASHLMLIAQKITKGMKVTFPRKRIGMCIAGFEVPHTHIHLMPADDMCDMDFKNCKSADVSVLSSVAERLRKSLLSLGYEEANITES